MFGNRGIYHKGSTAVTKRGTSWVLRGRKTVPLDDDVWELYDTTKSGARRTISPNRCRISCANYNACG
jgi:hypothetical protein